jgi:hypothetical protein
MVMYKFSPAMSNSIRFGLLYTALQYVPKCSHGIRFMRTSQHLPYCTAPIEKLTESYKPGCAVPGAVVRVPGAVLNCWC